MKLSSVVIVAAATFAAADNCQQGIMYCGYNLLRRGPSLPHPLTQLPRTPLTLSRELLRHLGRPQQASGRLRRLEHARRLRQQLLLGVHVVGHGRDTLCEVLRVTREL